MNMGQLTSFVQQWLLQRERFLTSITVAELSAKKAIECALKEYPELREQIRANCGRLAYLVPKRSTQFIFEQHLEFLAKKYGFEAFLLADPEAAVSTATGLFDEQSWLPVMEFEKRLPTKEGSCIVITYHFGPYYQLICALARARKIALATRVSGESLPTYRRVIGYLQATCGAESVNTIAGVRSALARGYRVIIVADQADFQKNRNVQVPVGPLLLKVRTGTIRLIEQCPNATMVCVGSYTAARSERLIVQSLVRINRNDRAEVGRLLFGALAQVTEQYPWEWDRIKYLHNMEAEAVG